MCERKEEREEEQIATTSADAITPLSFLPLPLHILLSLFLLRFFEGTRRTLCGSCTICALLFAKTHDNTTIFLSTEWRKDNDERRSPHFSLSLACLSPPFPFLTSAPSISLHKGVPHVQGRQLSARHLVHALHDVAEHRDLVLPQHCRLPCLLSCHGRGEGLSSERRGLKWRPIETLVGSPLLSLPLANGMRVSRKGKSLQDETSVKGERLSQIAKKERNKENSRD